VQWRSLRAQAKQSIVKDLKNGLLPAAQARGRNDGISMPFAIILSALSGYIALSYEIVWIRFYSVVSGGLAPVFAAVLGYYLVGLAMGAWLSRSFSSIRVLG